MATAIDDQRLAIGANGGPPLSPIDAFRTHIDDLFETAKGFLDGEPITTQEQADDVSRLKSEALKAEKDGTALRMNETRPLDEQKAAIMDAWRPLVDPKTGRCRLIVETCVKALTPFLQAEEDKRRAAAEAARQEAGKKAAAAQAAIRAADQADLSAREEAERLLKEAGKADAAANRAEKDRAQAKGGARAVSLVSVWTATIADRRLALNHYLRTNPEAFVETIQSLADHEARHGPRNAPGISFTETKVAR